ncbi:glycosyltransferase family 4 protein [Candidatus Woesebacteria bacterium]|nr:glycosyltransferase family 4 protein [Candidatus Woesebacteria bacterium]
MLIGINLLYLIPGKVGGTETYARELIPHLAKDNDLVIFCGKETSVTFKTSKNIQVVTLPIYSSNRVARLIVEQTILPIMATKYKIDVLFSLGYSAPFIHPCPSVVTIHDLNYHYHPEDFGSINRLVWNILTKLSAKFSDHIITDSSSSALSITRVLGLDRSKVTSILHATPGVIDTPAKKTKRPYLFTVLANYPHKNLKTLSQAFEIISKDNPELDLVICGLGKQASSTNRIKYLGYVTRTELASLYKGALAFIFPSSYEGFGYPVLEAMSYGTPVISSSATSLAEVVSYGGILVDPYDVSGYVKAIRRISKSKDLRKELIKQGKKRSSELKWANTAKTTLNILRKTINL